MVRDGGGGKNSENEWIDSVALIQQYHSILIPSPRVLSQAVFFQGHGDPEVYPRPDGDAYITGFPDPAITSRNPLEMKKCVRRW
ncbi:hypothetical protein ACHAWF_002191 [Thalassiosira exigua]